MEKNNPVKTVLFMLFIFLLFFLLELSSCSNPTEPCKEDTTSNGNDSLIVKKPNLYIYPTTKIKLNVKINFPNGGSVIKSIPEYKNEWEIIVDSTGIINEKYRYLFYECTTPDLFQYEKGWVVRKDKLREFFESNLKRTGFSEKEILDFIEYWIPILDRSEYYAIYPQYKEELASIVKLIFSKMPDNLLRLYYVIKECDGEFQIESTPEITEFNRTGFSVVEWGVIYNENRSERNN